MSWLSRFVGRSAETRASKPTKGPGAELTAPRRKQGPYAWVLETIREARDAQLRGQFDLPVRMAEGFRTDDALFTARTARIATQVALALVWRAADSGAGKLAAVARAERTIIAPQHTRQSILGTLADHGVAIGYVEYDVLGDGDLRLTLTEWPLEHVRFNASTNRLETRTKDGPTVEITHGDGRWIVFRKFGVAPWTQDACVLPGALLWAAHASGLQSWAGASYAHGQPKIIGEMPEGIALQSADGVTLSSDAQAFLEMLTAMVSGDVGAGIAPAGSKYSYLTSGSNAWQVFKELIDNREKAAARIYLGTDALLGSQGGAPGVDIAQLFNVASTRIQGDLEALERGYREGMIEPWCRLYDVAAKAAPRLEYLVPDPDADKRSEQASASIDRLGTALKALRDAQLEVTQDVVDALVTVLAVPVAAQLAAAETRTVPIALAPTDIARVVRVDEARASQGLPPLGDARGQMFISELEAQAEAEVEAAPAEDAPAEEPPPAEPEPAP